MYIDKLYNKLFSAGDKKGLETLMSEIRVFSMLDDKKEVAKERAENVIDARGVECPKAKEDIHEQIENSVLGNRN